MLALVFWCFVRTGSVWCLWVVGWRYGGYCAVDFLAWLACVRDNGVQLLIVFSGVGGVAGKFRVHGGLIKRFGLGFVFGTRGSVSYIGTIYVRVFFRGTIRNSFVKVGARLLNGGFFSFVGGRGCPSLDNYWSTRFVLLSCCGVCLGLSVL